MSDAPIICVIDDDASVLRGLSRLLSAWGHTVRAFSSAALFLEQPAHFDEEICCLVLDVHMPGMSGLELQAELDLARRPIPIVFMTGAGDAKLRSRTPSDTVVAFLEKPFAETELRQALDEALARARKRSSFSSAGPAR